MLGRFLQQSNQNIFDDRNHTLSDHNSTLAQSGPNEEIAWEEFSYALRISGKDEAPGPDKVQYSDIKNLAQ